MKFVEKKKREIITAIVLPVLRACYDLYANDEMVQKGLSFDEYQQLVNCVLNDTNRCLEKGDN